MLITMEIWKRALHWKYGNVLITMKIWKLANYNENMETC